MKKIITLAALIAALGVFYYLYTSGTKVLNTEPNESYSMIQDTLPKESVTTMDFTWTATSLDGAPTGGSDFISAFDLSVSASDRTYQVNDYLDKKIYGCREVSNESRDSILSQYDNLYTSAFLSASVSSYLCASMGGGDLFVIEKNGDGYVAYHYSYSDGSTPLTQSKPVRLFSIQK